MRATKQGRRELPSAPSSIWKQQSPNTTLPSVGCVASDARQVNAPASPPIVRQIAAQQRPTRRHHNPASIVRHDVLLNHLLRAERGPAMLSGVGLEILER